MADVKLAADLKAARSLLERPEAWIASGNAGETQDGMGINVWSERACRFCVIGAFWRIHGMRDEDRAFPADILKPFTTVGRWNDASGRTHADVLALFDRAIAIAEAA